jgi:hypothetical protein
MQFQVPQFLDVEDKIIGPFTIKQFIYLAGSVGFAYVAWRYIPYLGILVSMGFLALGGALAFYRPNQKPFVYLIESAATYITSSRLYVWKRKTQEKMETEFDLGNFQTTTTGTHIPGAMPQGGKLDDLTWSIDLQSSSATESGPPRSENLRV